MLILTKAILAAMLGFLGAIFTGLVLIPILKQKKLNQQISVYLKEHSGKVGTPTMGGLIFIIPTIVVLIGLLMTNKIQYSSNLFITVFVFISFSILGFIDDYKKLIKKDNEGLSELEKLTGQLFISAVFFFIFLKNGGSPVLNIYTLGIKLDMDWLYGAFLLFVLVGSSNAVNLTDGLDGLAGGLSLIAFVAFGIIAWGSSWVLGHESLAIFCFILVGSLLGFLFFNSHPARVFMGDCGSLSLGGTLATIAILTNHEITLVIVAGVFVIEALSSIIQIFSIKVRHKKVFLMAPLHHHFEKLNWSEQDIVKVFYFFGLVFGMAAIAFGVWI